MHAMIARFLIHPIGTPAELPAVFEAPALVILLAQSYGPA
ncbi:hypothetical protein NONO_c60020 [Nocardia nova SH22a]|uniref:Uncharacterized protein n=1 Tax=Nocardia nova SH22a TaxID=1415166 RepID=W5TPA4_9NOCA|nr:hypothetical protein NONO_c60020 [Nocardia nova SH22a]